MIHVDTYKPNEMFTSLIINHVLHIPVFFQKFKD